MCIMNDQNKNRPPQGPPSLEEAKIFGVDEFLASVALKDIPQPPPFVTGSVADRPPITTPPHYDTYETYRHDQETAARLRGEDSPFAP
jgi:hypothetical protein